MEDETVRVDVYSGQLAVLLEGGPADIPLDRRERLVEVGDGTVKLPRYGGYEHFERTDEYTTGQGGQPRLIYRWVSRTRIAE